LLINLAFQRDSPSRVIPRDEVERIEASTLFASSSRMAMDFSTYLRATPGARCHRSCLLRCYLLFSNCLCTLVEPRARCLLWNEPRLKNKLFINSFSLFAHMKLVMLLQPNLSGPVSIFRISQLLGDSEITSVVLVCQNSIP